MEGPGDFPFLNPRIASAILSGSGTTSSISNGATSIGGQSGGKDCEYSLIRSFVTFLRSSQDGGVIAVVVVVVVVTYEGPTHNTAVRRIIVGVIDKDKGPIILERRIMVVAVLIIINLVSGIVIAVAVVVVVVVVVVNIILTVSNIGHPFFLQVHGLDLPVWINKLSPLTTNLLSLH